MADLSLRAREGKPLFGVLSALASPLSPIAPRSWWRRRGSRGWSWRCALYWRNQGLDVEAPKNVEEDEIEL